MTNRKKAEKLLELRGWTTPEFANGFLIGAEKAYEAAAAEITRLEGKLYMVQQKIELLSKR